MEKPIQTGTVGAPLGQIADQLGGELLGPADFIVARLTSADCGDAQGLAFAEQAKYVKEAKAAGVGALLVGPDIDPEGIPAVRVPKPRLAFLMLLTVTDRPYAIREGVHPTAVIDPAALVEDGAKVGPYAVVEAGATVRKGAHIHAHAYVGELCEVKADAVLLPHAVLLRNVELGARSVVFPGAVIGSEGFGFVFDGKRQIKIPQVGRVVIGADCEIGALSAIDRATAGKTQVGDDTKFDNFVQLAHNCTVGEHTVMAAFTGVGGSTKIGDRCTFGGSTTLADHVSVASDVMLGGRAGVTSSIDEPGVYFDFPATPLKSARRNLVLRTKLDEMVSRIRKLEARLAALEGDDK